MSFYFSWAITRVDIYIIHLIISSIDNVTNNLISRLSRNSLSLNITNTDIIILSRLLPSRNYSYLSIHYFI